MIKDHIPTMAQFLVLGILKVSHSTFQPQCTLNDASQILYMEYELELELVASPPRLSDSVNLERISGCEGGSSESDVTSFWESVVILVSSAVVEKTTLEGIVYGVSLERSYLASNTQAQHGIDRYPEASHKVERTGSHGVSSSA